MQDGSMRDGVALATSVPPVRLVIEVDRVTGQVRVTGTVLGDRLVALGLLEAAKFALLQAAAAGGAVPRPGRIAVPA